jgi:dTMP kinase
LLLKGSDDRWSARSEALLFAAARADHVEKTILPALAAGKWILCDRFLDSSRAYQGGAGGISDAEITELHRFGSQGLLPDRTLVLDMPVGDASARAKMRDDLNLDRMGAKQGNYYDRVAEHFRQIADEEPGRVRLIDASGTENQVTERLLLALDDYLTP